MTAVYLLDPAPSAEWLPFADCRPLSELRAGAWLTRERWEAVADGETQTIFGAEHLYSFIEDGVAPVTAVGTVSGPAVVGRSTFAPSGVRPEFPRTAARLVNDGTTVGWWVPEGSTWEADHDDGPELEIEGVTLRGVYDLITALEHLLAGDTADFTREQSDPVPEGCIVVGDPSDVVILGGIVEPGVVFDVRGGTVVIEQHTYVKSDTRLEGPVFVGPGTEILGGVIRFCSIGPRCRVRGELASSVLLGYANKAHDGFVGHSVLGRWVNLGAGTTTSNLKNTYGSVRVSAGRQPIETERQYLGTLFGDHAKVAIGTQLDTGTIVGAGANVFGRTRPPKYVPPFAWGTEGEVMERDGFLTVATRVMPRRNVEVTDEVKASLTAIYGHAVER